MYQFTNNKCLEGPGNPYVAQRVWNYTLRNTY